MKTAYTLFFSVLLSCGGQTYDQRSPGKETPVTSGECQPAAGKACLEGHVVFAPWVLLDGRTFFNASEMGKYLEASAISLKHQETQLKTGQTRPISAISSFDENTFSQGFTLYLKGDRALHRPVSRDGFYILEELSPGTYDIMLKRPVKVDLLVGNDRISYCSTIYAEKRRLEIREKDAIYLGFDTFNLRSALGPCAG